MNNDGLVIGGITPMTTIDFPGRLAAVIFCQGCPWRCRYCQNVHLLPREAENPVSWEHALDLLGRRKGLLDGVVFSGGEPLLQSTLAPAIAEVREMGFQIGLHTAGIYPERFKAILPLLEWVGLDIKASTERYDALTQVPGSAGKAWECLQLLQESGIEYEVRTTVHPELMDDAELLALAEKLANSGVTNFILQGCIPGHCLDETLRLAPTQFTIDEALKLQLEGMFPEFSCRGL